VIKKLEKGDKPSLTADELKMAGIET
jgi:hypothetical protein